MTLVRNQPELAQCGVRFHLPGEEALNLLNDPTFLLDGIDLALGTVQDVPEPNEHLKILTSTDGRSLLVLDLLARTASPIH